MQRAKTRVSEAICREAVVAASKVAGCGRQVLRGGAQQPPSSGKLCLCGQAGLRQGQGRRRRGQGLCVHDEGAAAERGQGELPQRGNA